MAEESGSSLQGQDLSSLFNRNLMVGRKWLLWHGDEYLPAAQISRQGGKKTEHWSPEKYLPRQGTSQAGMAWETLCPEGVNLWYVWLAGKAFKGAR